MTDKSIVKSLVDQWLEGKDYFLVDIEISSDNKIVSLKEVLNLLAGVGDGTNTIQDVIDARITEALGEEGAITSAIGSAISDAIDTNGSIETWADGRYAAKVTQ